MDNQTEIERNRDRDTVENINREQQDPAQAQNIVQDAERIREGVMPGDQPSEHGDTDNPANVLPEDAQDTVDHMVQMERSGQIDNSAFRGEPMMDDVEDELGLTDRPDHPHRDLDGQQ